MSRVNPSQNAFVGGELSPRCYGRTDIEKYGVALKQLYNFTLQPQGGATRRLGSIFVGPSRDDLNMTLGAVLLVPFQFSTTQAYMLEFGHQYVRFFANGDRVVENPVTISNFAGGIVTTATAHGYASGDWVTLSNIVLIGGGASDTPVNGEFQITVADTTHFTLAGYSGSGTYSSGGTVNRIYQVTTIYQADDLENLYFSQSADVLFIGTLKYPTSSLNRLAPVNWTFGPVTFLDGPYQAENTDSTKTMTASGASGAITVSSSFDAFVSTDVGRMIRIRSGTTAVGWGTITAFTDTKHVSVTAGVTDGFSFPTSAVFTWRLGSFSATTGYAAVLGFYQSRFAMAHTNLEPQATWLSVSSDLFNFQPTNEKLVVGDSNAISYTIYSSKSDAIVWMDGGQELLIGTVGAEWILEASSTSQVLSPTNVKVTRQTVYGSQSNVAPQRIGSRVLFSQRGGRKVRELVYNYAQGETGGYQANDISVLSEHLPRLAGGIKQMTFQQEPDTNVWMVGNDGSLIGLTYLAEQNVSGWHHHNLAGQDAKVISAAVIPGTSTNGEDQLWLAVQRTINGHTRTYIEYLSQTFEPVDANDKSSAFFVDCGLTYNGTPTSSVSGLNHLEGETVAIFADGCVHPAKQVVNGKVALQRASSVVNVGLPYTSIMSILCPEAGGNRGTAQAKLKRIHKVGIRFSNTLGGFVGPNMDETEAFEELIFLNDGDDAGTSPPLLSDDMKVDVGGDWDLDSPLVIWTQQPCPMTVLALFPEMEVSQ